MRDLDPQLMRLHELEAKIVMLSDRLGEAEQRLASLDFGSREREPQKNYRVLLIEALEILRTKRDAIVERMNEIGQLR